MAYELITRSEYKSYAGIASTNSDEEIDSLLPKVSELVKTYCRRRFNEWLDEVKTEVFSGNTSTLILQEEPVIQVLSVETSADYGQTWTALTQYTDWVLDGNEIVNIVQGEWTKLVRGYRVNYYCGYETVPQDLKLAVMDLVTYYRQNDASVHSTKAPGTNSVQIEYISTTSLPAHIKRILDFYVMDYT
jgi:hypothetical protein